MRFSGRYLALALILLLPGILLTAPQYDTHAQETETCQALVAEAFTALTTICAQPARNEGCVALGPVAVTGEETSQTVAAGERFALETLRAIEAAPLDIRAGTWGVVALGEGAGLPVNTREQVTLWLFGGAELVDSRTEEQRHAPPAATCYGTVVTDTLNMRAFPSTNGTVLGTLSRGDRIIITGRLADTSWWRIDYPDPAQAAWLFSGYVRTDCQIVEIPVVQRDAPGLSTEDWYRDPFQVAALRTQPLSASCIDAPPPGLLLQPPDTGRSRITLNGVSFELTSSLYAQADAGQELLLQAIEGAIVLTPPDGSTLEIPAGSQLRFPLSPDGMTVSGPPLKLEPLNLDELRALPLERLPHPLEALPRPVIEIPVEESTLSGDLVPGDPLTFYIDQRAGVMHEITLDSDAFPVLSILAPDAEVVRPLINQGHLSFSYWPTSDQPHLFRLEAGSARRGSYTLRTSTRDIRLCRPGGNSQSRTLPGGEDHAGNIWFGREGEVVRLAVAGDVSTSAANIPNWRLRIAEMFLENATLPPVEFDLLEGHNADAITWEVPRTGYYWIEVWTVAGGTTTVTSQCP